MAIFSFAFLVVSFSIKQNTLGINIHDTYYVILNQHLYWIISSVLFLFFVLYQIFNWTKFPVYKRLKNFHIITTLISVIGITFPYQLFYDENDIFSNGSSIANLIITISAFLFLVSFLIFIIELILGIFFSIKTLVKA